MLGEISHPVIDKDRYGRLSETRSYHSTRFPEGPVFLNLKELTGKRNLGTKYSGETDGLNRSLRKLSGK